MVLCWESFSVVSFWCWRSESAPMFCISNALIECRDLFTGCVSQFQELFETQNMMTSFMMNKCLLLISVLQKVLIEGFACNDTARAEQKVMGAKKSGTPDCLTGRSSEIVDRSNSRRWNTKSAQSIQTQCWVSKISALIYIYSFAVNAVLTRAGLIRDSRPSLLGAKRKRSPVWQLQFATVCSFLLSLR